MRRRLDLAASLIIRPKVLFLDEPTTGLDPRGRMEMWGVIEGLVRDGVTLQLTRVPEVLIFNTIQPVMFVLLFRYLFGGLGVGIEGGYVQLLIPGIFVQRVAFNLAATAQGLAQDMEKGLIDRFRSLIS